MKLVEDYRSDKDCRIFRWVKGKNEVAYIALYSDGLVEFHSRVTSGDISIERVGQKDEQILIDQLSIQVGTVDPKKSVAKVAS